LELKKAFQIIFGINIDVNSLVGRLDKVNLLLQQKMTNAFIAEPIVLQESRQGLGFPQGQQRFRIFSF
jgi:hypothetical protein